MPRTDSLKTSEKLFQPFRRWEAKGLTTKAQVGAGPVPVKPEAIQLGKLLKKKKRHVIINTKPGMKVNIYWEWENLLPQITGHVDGEVVAPEDLFWQCPELFIGNAFWLQPDLLRVVPLSRVTRWLLDPPGAWAEEALGFIHSLRSTSSLRSPPLFRVVSSWKQPRLGGGSPTAQDSGYPGSLLGGGSRSQGTQQFGCEFHFSEALFFMFVKQG